MREFIYYHRNELKPKGGPSGYLYNLNKGLLECNVCGIDFLPDRKITIKNKIRAKIINYPKVYKIIHNLTHGIYGDNILNMIFHSKKYDAVVDLNDYDVVHFHNTLDMYMCKDSLNFYKGKVLLTSHSPKVFHKELLDDFADSTKNRRISEIEAIDVIDKYAFERADYIIFPVPEATECYFNTWDKFESIYNKNKQKFYYLPTGTTPKKYSLNKSEFREKYGIPQDAFVVSYIGRHNEVKGYDTVKKVAQLVLEKYDDIYFVIGGQQGPLYQLNNKKWIEIGWTNDPGSIINGSDIFMLPNKETYFDLVMLEVLSIGTPVVTSYTGGNKYFERFGSKGITLYKSNEELIEAILKFKNSTEDLEILRNENRKLYNDYFSNEKFARGYLQLVNELYDK